MSTSRYAQQRLVHVSGSSMYSVGGQPRGMATIERDDVELLVKLAVRRTQLF
uniref:hypothetical protein n=1 Tax=Streptomyces antimycoticus TaxID=68175 RepID=UPI002F9089B7